ncbi:hypothetical protein LTR95_008646 [Oleoguttula sp. CCFEE 5521]
MPIVPQPATAALLLCYAGSARAFTTLTPNCTLPALEPGSAFNVVSPKLRSTFNILWSSLATIIACTYSVMHLNVPRQRNGRDPGWKGDLKWWWKAFRVKMKCSVIAMFAPEWYLLVAAIHYHAARKLQRRLQDLGDSVHGGRRWSISECFHIDMAGYGISRWTSVTDREVTRLQAHSFVQVLELNPSLVLPQLLDADEVAARSKSDVFTRSIVLTQILYFVVAVISRWIEHQPVTPLEVGTLAFTMYSFCTYGLYWHKPQGVTAVTIIALYDHPISESLSMMLPKDEEDDAFYFSTIDKGLAWEAWVEILFLGGPLLSFTFACTSAIFSAIHLAAWNSTFPTTVERIVWRVATLVSALAFAIICLLDVLLKFDAVWWLLNRVRDRLGSQRLDKAVEGLVASIFVVTTVVYVLARLVIIVEMFRSLAYLPLDAYVTTSWPANVPHFG